MTYEYAVYFQLLLLCGYKDDMEQFLDAALEEQDPLSDIVLELVSTGSDDKKTLSILNEYTLQVQDSDINYAVVFKLVMAFLKRRYVEDAISIQDITGLMERIAVYTGRYLYEPWKTMYLLGLLFDEAEVGYIDKADYRRKFDAFINDNICFRDYPPVLPNDNTGFCDRPPVLPKESFFKRLIKKIQSICKKSTP